MLRFLAICLGGAIGTGARYLVTLAGYGLFGERFPVGTLAVNLAGCFFMGVIGRLAMDRAISDDLRLFLGTGIMGGLTTYSAFNNETLRFIQKGDWGMPWRSVLP